MKRIVNNKGVFSDINVTPLVDVMLVLLIIFMVTTPMLIRTIKVNLPRSSAASSTIAKKDIIVSINKNGKYFLENIPIKERSLDAYFKTHTNINLIINADKNVDYGAVVNIISLAKSAGIVKVGLSTQPKK